MATYKAYEEHIEDCAVCGDVCCERDAVWVEGDDKAKIDAANYRGAVWVCIDCARSAGLWHKAA